MGNLCGSGGLATFARGADEYPGAKCIQRPLQRGHHRLESKADSLEARNADPPVLCRHPAETPHRFPS